MAFLAEGILKLHWDQTVPVNIARIVKQMGVRLQLASDLPASAVLTIAADNRAHIALCSQQSSLHQRYAVAHALAHVALHHLRPGMSQTIQVGHNFRLDFALPRMQEAHEFALRLLMPEAALRYALETMQARDWEELAHVFAVPVLFVKQRMAELQLQLPRAAPTALRGFTIDL